MLYPSSWENASLKSIDDEVLVAAGGAMQRSGLHGSRFLSFPALARNQHDIAHVDKRGQSLAKNNHRLTLHQTVDERHQASDHGEYPERERNDAFASTLTRDPLHDKAARKSQLGDEAEGQPEVKLVPEDFTEVVAKRGTELNKHQRTSETSGTRRLRRMSHHTPARSRMPTHSRSHMP